MHPPRVGPSLALLLLALSSPLLGQETPFRSPHDPLPLDPRVRTGTLDNGLRYFVRVNGRPQNRAELRLVVNAGSVLEDEDQRGLAHFLEHMAFNGTANFEKQELVSYLESIGMAFGPEVNAYTSFDETVYMLQVPTDDPGILDTAFQILEDWAHLVSLEGEEIEKERGVVIEEWRLGRGANARMLDRQIPVLFQGSRYAERLPIGKVEVLESFSHETLRRFYEDWYRPDLMAVAAVGDFDAGAVEARIREHFSRLPAVADPRPRVLYGVPGHRETLFALASDPEATNSQVALFFKQEARERGTLVQYRQGLVERLHSGLLNTRLFELTQQADPPFVYGGAGQGTFVRTSEFFQLFALVPEGGIPRGLEALLTEAERVARHGFTPSELEREKANLLRGVERLWAERDNQESSRFAAEYVRYFLQGAPIPGIEFEFEAVQALLPAITLQEVNQVARDRLGDRDRVVLANAPEKEGPPLPTEDELAGVFRTVMAAEIAPYEDEAADLPLLAEIPSPLPVVAEDSVPELGLTEWTLANGVRVLLKPTDFKEDEVLFQAYSPGGWSLSSLEDHMSATSAADLVSLGGVGEFSLVELNKQLAGKAVTVSPSIGEMEEGLSGSASPRDLEILFQLIHLYFTAPRKDETAFQAFQRQVEAFLANRAASPAAAFQDTLTVTMSQRHPRVRLPTVESFREIDLDRAFAFYEDRFADASDFTFVFVGAIQPDQFRPLAERYLGSLPALRREESWEDLGIRPPSGVVRKEVRRGMEPQSQTQILFTGPFDYTAQDRLGMRALASVLDIRLREVVREEMGGTYGVQVQGTYQKYPEERYTFRIAFGSDPGRVEELVRAIMEEIEALKENGPSPEDIGKVVEQERRSRETNLRENRWWVAQLRFADQYGSDPRSLLDTSLLDRVTPESVRGDARRYLRTDHYVQITLFPEAGK